MEYCRDVALTQVLVRRSEKLIGSSAYRYFN